MPIITISRGCFSKGRIVANAVAQKLGYQCVARELLLEASKEYNIQEFMLERAIHDAISILDRLTYGKERYIALFQSAFFRYMRRDDVVYHGLAGHFFLKDVRHALKIRIIADMSDRVEWLIAHEPMEADKALEILRKDDQERRKWSLALYGIDTTNPNLYDLVINIGKLKVPEVVDLICRAAQADSVQPTPESRRLMEDLAVAADVKAALVHMKPNIRVRSRNGLVFIDSKTPIKSKELIKEIRLIAGQIPGVKEVEVSSSPVERADTSPLV